MTEQELVERIAREIIVTLHQAERMLGLIKKAGWKSLEEQALMFNPNYLDFQKGVAEGRKLEHESMLKAGYVKLNEVPPQNNKDLPKGWRERIIK